VFTLVCAIAALTLLSGCGEMQIVNKKDFTRVNDPREDIRLVQLSADLTTAGIIQHRVKGTQATYSQAKNLLLIDQIDVTSFNAEGTTQGITEADSGTIYLAADASAGRNRSDIRFVGDVNYRSPAPDNPSTDTMQLRTDELIYNDVKQEFEGTSTHTVVMMPPGKRPMYMQGSQLRVPRDLKRFSMLKGSVSPTQSDDLASSYTRLSKELQDIARSASAGQAAPARPTPIQVETPEPAPQRPPEPSVPRIQPSPTPVPTGVLR
jgi:hypothetical protein